MYSWFKLLSEEVHLFYLLLLVIVL